MTPLTPSEGDAVSSLPESQLEQWAQPLSTVAHLGAQATVQKALTADPRLAGHRYEVFLHGSYRNGTVIDPTAGVDVVVQLNDSYYESVSDLPPEHQKLFKTFSPMSASVERWSTFKTAVAQALETATRHPVRAGDKSLQFTGAFGSPAVHVLVGYQYRLYYTFGASDQRHREGVIFFTGERRSLISYPKLHCEQLAKKNAKTQDAFKRLVRIFKHLQHSLINSKTIPAGSAPSYYIEGLLFNVPDEMLMAGTLRARLEAVVELLQRVELSSMKTINGIQPLCGEGAWAAADAKGFLKAVASLLSGPGPGSPGGADVGAAP